MPDGPRPGYYPPYRVLAEAADAWEWEEAAVRERQTRRLALRGYRTEVVQLDDGQFYWHVWKWNVRINGGLSESRHTASRDAEDSALKDMYAAPK